MLGKRSGERSGVGKFFFGFVVFLGWGVYNTNVLNMVLPIVTEREVRPTGNYGRLPIISNLFLFLKNILGRKHL